MAGGERDDISKLYHALTGIGEDAASRTIPQTDTTSKRSAASPAVVIGAPQAVQTQPSTTVLSPTSPPVPLSPALPGASRASLPLVNPVRVCGAALATVLRNFWPFVGFGVLSVVVLTITSNILIGANILARSANLNRPFVQIVLVAGLAYVLVLWVRIGRHGLRPAVGSDVGTGFSVVSLAAAIAFFVIYAGPWIYGSNVPPSFGWAVAFTRYWPLHGPYASLASGAQMAIWPNLPPAATFFEPITHAVALTLPVVALMPFVLREYAGAAPDWFRFVIRLPLILVAVFVTTIPVAILNGYLAPWIRTLIASDSNRLRGAVLLSTICYVQVVLVGAVIGECYRRVSRTGP